MDPGYRLFFVTQPNNCDLEKRKPQVVNVAVTCEDISAILTPHTCPLLIPHPDSSSETPELWLRFVPYFQILLVLSCLLSRELSATVGTGCGISAQCPAHCSLCQEGHFINFQRFRDNAQDFPRAGIIKVSFLYLPVHLKKYFLLS